MRENSGARPPSSSAPARRSDMLADSTRFTMGKPKVSGWGACVLSHTLAPVESANSAAFRCLYRLTIHDYNRWTRGSACLRSHLLLDASLHGGPHAAVLCAEVVIYGAPHREVPRQQTPLAAGAQQMEDSVEDGAQVSRASPATSSCGRQQRRDKRPGSIGEIRRIQF